MYRRLQPYVSGCDSARPPQNQTSSAWPHSAAPLRPHRGLPLSGAAARSERVARPGALQGSPQRPGWRAVALRRRQDGALSVRVRVPVHRLHHTPVDQGRG